MKQALTTGEIAKHCGVSFRTVIRWIERGHLKSYKLPGRGDNRVQLEDFVDFLTANNMPIPEGFVQKNERILVLDDDRPMSEAIARVFKSQKYDVDIANSGFEAGAMLTAHEPGLMTLDLSMPGLDGFQMLGYIRKHCSGKLKILVISGLQQIKLDEAVAAGADASIKKPFDSEELIDTVKKLLES